MKHKKLKIKRGLSSVFKTIIKYLSLLRLKIFAKYRCSHSSGFTLVELLVYSVIFAVTVGLLSGILIAITGVQTRETAAFEITRQLQFVTQRMQHTIRDASVIGEVFEGANPAAPCVQFCSIRLRVANPTLDPTIISSDIGGVYIQEGNNPRVALTTPAARITSLIFRRTANPEGLTTVAVDFGMVLNPDDPQLRVERRLQSGIAHVSAATFNADILPDSSGARNIGGTNLRWNNLILSGGVTIIAPGTAGDHVGISMERGTTHGSSRIIQYYLPSTPRDRFGQRFEIGGTPILHLEGDMNDTTRRAYFLNSNVGIGTTTPGRRLHLVGTMGIDELSVPFIIRETDQTLPVGVWRIPADGGGFRLDRNTAVAGDLSTFRTPWAVNSAGLLTLGESGDMNIPSAGNVGIGTTGPGQRLQVGNAGDGTTAVANAWNVFSDIRLKTNIKEIQDALGIVSKLRGIKFDWEKSKERSIGFIAQEVEKTLPQVVFTDANGYKSVDYSKITSVLVEAIKEQQKQIEELRAANKNLKLENEMIRKRIEILEAK